MHKVYCKGIRSLEDKFDKEHADWIENNVGTIRFDNIPFTDASAYNKKYIIILTEEEYQTLKEGFTGSISQEFADRLIVGLDALLSQLKAEKAIKQ